MAEKDKNMHVFIDGEEVIFLTDRIIEDQEPGWIVAADMANDIDLMPIEIFRLLHPQP